MVRMTTISNNSKYEAEVIKNYTLVHFEYSLASSHF